MNAIVVVIRRQKSDLDPQSHKKDYHKKWELNKELYVLGRIENIVSWRNQDPLILWHLICSYGTDSTEWSIGIGLHDMQTIYTSNVMRVSHVYVHEKYVPEQEKNDIALIKLSKSVDINGK